MIVMIIMILMMILIVIMLLMIIVIKIIVICLMIINTLGSGRVTPLAEQPLASTFASYCQCRTSTSRRVRTQFIPSVIIM